MKKVALMLILPVAIFAAFFCVGECQAGEIKLTWKPVDGCTYQVHYGNASRVYTRTLEATETECTLTLAPGVYYFAVTAHWKVCNYTLCASEYSDEVSLMLSDKPEIVTISLITGQE